MSLISVLHSWAYETRRERERERTGCCVLHISNRVKCVGYESNDENLNFHYLVDENKETKRLFFQYSASKILQSEFLAG